MCFYIEEKNKDIKIAKKNITCYKRFDLIETNDKFFVSPFQTFFYEKGAHYIENDMHTEANENIINVGLHSYTTYHNADYNRMSYEIIVKCIIPKGAKYFVNKYDGEYVSDQIIIGKKEYKPKPKSKS